MYAVTVPTFAKKTVSVFGDVYQMAVQVPVTGRYVASYESMANTSADGNDTSIEPPPVPTAVTAAQSPYTAFSHVNMVMNGVSPSSMPSTGGPVAILGSFLPSQTLVRACVGMCQCW